MNLIRLAVLFLMITLPLQVIVYTNVNQLQLKKQIEVVYRERVAVAVQDGALALKQFVSQGYDAEQSSKVQVNPDEVIKTFMATYHYGFNAIGERDKVKMNQYILALVVVGYDGFYLYGCQETMDSYGRKVIRPVLSEKKPYLYKREGYTIKMTLDDYIYVLDDATLELEEGIVSEISQLPTTIDPTDYNWFKQQVIVDSITRTLSETVNLHNQYVRQLGTTYEFYIPYGDNASFADTIDDVGLLAIVQGQPLGRGDYLNIMTFNQGEVTIKKQIFGYQTSTGDFYYCDDGCTHPMTDPLITVFASAKEAAKMGYYPCYMVR